jgi:hypothetical protein
MAADKIKEILKAEGVPNDGLRVQRARMLRTFLRDYDR